jgi:hypothetical protein
LVEDSLFGIDRSTLVWIWEVADEALKRWDVEKAKAKA